MRSPAIAVLAGALACGYGFSQRYVAKGGAARIHVRPFENLSSEPGLAAAVTAALRDELARRGADAGEEAPAAIGGDARATEPTPTSAGGATWTVGVEVRARLVADGKPVAERTVRRSADYLGGADPLEAEGRRALALRRLAADAARDVLRAFER